MKIIAVIFQGSHCMANQPLARRLLSTALLCGALVACTPNASTAANGAADSAEGPVVAAPAPDGSTSPPAFAGRALPDFAALVDAYGAAVVNVSVIASREPVSDQGGAPQVSPNDPLYDFFRRFGVPTPRGGNQPPARGEGSGFIVTPDGYILSNAHVVDGAGEVTVRLTDRREFQAKVVGVDKRTDVAVLKIDAKNLPTVKIGDPSKLKPGEWVAAIGSPFGFENSVTAGIVSATSRSLPEDNYVPFIQTDVAVNPGNSGGPLFNLNGEVVGINSQIYSRTGGYMGLSFAIPIDVANNVRDQLVKTGRVSRGRIGVTIQEVNAQLADSFGLERPRGALVGSVESGSPGDKAGLKPGDVILSVNGKSVDRSAQVPGMIASVKPNTDATLEVWRDRQSRQMKVRVAELDEPVQKASLRTEKSDDASAKLGLTLRLLDARERSQIETDGTVVVEEAIGPAANAGVEAGDIILGVNGTPVKTIADLQTAAKKSTGKTVALLIQRDDAQIFVPVRIG